MKKATPRASVTNTTKSVNLTLDSSIPNDDATGIAKNANIILTFSQNIKKGTGSITLTQENPAGTQNIDINDSSISIANNQLIIAAPATGWLNDGSYSVQMPRGIVRSLDGKSFAGISDKTTLNFTVVDNEAPIIKSIAPANKSTNILPGNNFTLWFNESIKAGTGSIIISNGMDTHTIDINSSQVVISGKLVKINPDKDLKSDGSTYTIKVSSGVVMDLSNNLYKTTSDEPISSFRVKDLIAPTLLSTIPAIDAKDVSPSTSLILTFSENIKVGSGLIMIKSSMDTRNIPISDSKQITINENQLIIDPVLDWQDGAVYSLEIADNTISDSAQSPNFFKPTTAPKIMTFSVADTKNPLLTKAIYSAAASSAGNTNIKPDSNIILAFSEVVQPEKGNIIITNGEDIQVIPVTDTKQVSFRNNMVTINPATNLQADGSTYRIEIGEGIINDLSRQAYVQIKDDEKLIFSTMDIKPPEVKKAFPTGNDIETDTDITLTFSEPVKAGTGSVILRNKKGGTVSIKVSDSTQVKIDNETVNINPASTLLNNQTYTIEVGSGVFQDIAGNSSVPYSGAGTSSFTTRIGTTFPEITSSMPLDDQSAVVINSDIVLTFSEPVQAGKGIINIIGQADTVTVNVTDSKRVAVKGNTVTINPADDLLANEKYYITMEEGVIYGTAGNPFKGISNTDTLNFFTTDTLAPILLDSTPLNTAQDVPFTADLTLTFNEPVQIGKGSVTLKNTVDTRVIPLTDGKQITLSNDKITINPASDLLQKATYVMEISRGSIMDTVGNPFAGLLGKSVISFTTGSNSKTKPGSESTGNNAESSGSESQPVEGTQFNLAIASDKTSLKSGESALLTFTFSEIPSDFIASDIVSTGGILDTLTVDGSGRIYTALFTPDSELDTWIGSVSVAANTYTNSIGAPGASNGFISIFGDTLSPSVTITSEKTSLKAGESGKIIFAFTEPPEGFSESDIAINTGTLKGLAVTGDDKIWTAIYTPPSESTQTVTVSLASGSYTDAVGNPGQAGTHTLLVDSVLPVLSVAGTTAKEGDSGNSDATVTVSLSVASTETVTVDYATQDGTAQAGMDYVAVNGTLTFNPGEMNMTIPVSIIGDSIMEAEETIQIQLSNAVNATLDPVSSASIILAEDDTMTSTLTISSEKAFFGAGDTAKISFNFSEKPSNFTITDISVAGGKLGALSVDKSGLVYSAEYAPNYSSDTWTGGISVAANTYTDSSGNPGVASNNLILNGDTLVPSVTSSFPTNEASAIAVDSKLTINFSESITRGTGKLTLNTGKDTRTIDIDDSTQIAVNGTQLTVMPKEPLQPGANYSIMLDSGMVKDLAGNDFPGIQDAKFWNFKTLSSFSDSGLSPRVSFQPQTKYPTGTGPYAVALGDVNGDGKMDATIANNISSTVSVLLGKGDGTFQEQIQYAVGKSPESIALKDFNNDKYLDIVTVNTQDRNISVLLGKANGSFDTKSIDTNAGAIPRSISIGDINKDGWQDIALVNSGSDTVSILQGSGDGHFSRRIEHKSGGKVPFATVLGDVNHDGSLDMVVVHSQSNEVTVLTQQKNGNFSVHSRYPTGSSSRSVSLKDMNNDGHLDIVATNVNNVGTEANNVLILSGKGDGNFTRQAAYTTGRWPSSVTVADMNGDSTMDITVANVNSANISTLLGQGDGTFPTQTDHATKGPMAVEVGDLNNDTYLDMVVANYFTNQVSVFINNTFDLPSISVNDVMVSEGNDQANTVQVVVRLSMPSEKVITVDYDTKDGSSVSGLDYKKTSGTITFSPGQTSKTIQIPILGELLIEDDEGLFLNLSNPVNATLSENNGATVIIKNDDTVFPEVTIASDKAKIKAKETAILTFSFNDVPENFTIDDIKVTDGVVTNLGLKENSDDTANTVYTAQWTPAGALDIWTSTASIAAGSYTDKAGNINLASNELTLSGDTLTPTLTISSDKNFLKAGETGQIIFTFSESPLGFTKSDVLVSKGTLGLLTPDKSGKIWTSTYTPSSTGNFTVTFQVSEDGYTDAAGNPGRASNVHILTVDTIAPEVSISSDTITLKADATAALTFRFSEAVKDFDNTDIQVDGGTLENLTGSNLVYTGTFVPQTGKNTLNGNVSVAANTYIDAVGNPGMASNKFTLIGDTLPPSLSITSDRANLRAGETTTLTFDFSEVPTGFSDLDVKVTGGTLGKFKGSDRIRTVVFTPQPNMNALDASVQVAADSYTDRAGNPGKAISSLSIKGDTLLPGLAISSDKTELKMGEATSLTFRFTETPKGFDASDINLDGGTLDKLTGTGLVYTANFTPMPDNNDLKANVSVTAEAYTDEVGNPGLASNKLTITGDTQRPSLVIVSEKANLRAGDTSILTFKFSEIPAGFDEQDIQVSGGSLSGFKGRDFTRTAIFTPEANMNTLKASILVADNTYTDGPGNPGTAGTLTLNGDTLKPEVTISSDKNSLKINETSQITFTFSESPLDFTTSDIIASAGTLTNLIPDASGEVWTATYMPPLNRDKEVTLKIEKDSYTDSAGNAGKASNVHTLNIDTMLPMVSIQAVAFKEGDTGKNNAEVTVRLSTAFSQPVTVKYATQDGTALATSDYTATAGVVRFAPGETSQTIAIPVQADQIIESDETFVIQLADPTNALVNPVSGIATVTLVNDDQPVISIGDVTLKEGNSGITQASLTVRLSQTSDRNVTVNYDTEDETAKAQLPSSLPAAGTLVLIPGETTKSVAVPITGGMGDASLTVSLPGASTQTVTVKYTTDNEKAQVAADYSATQGNLVFRPGESSKTITIPVYGDTTAEINETFKVRLSEPVNALIDPVGSTATVTLSNDDKQPYVSISNTTLEEGDVGNTSANVVVSLSAPSSQTVTVNYAIQDGTAREDSDYTGPGTGVITFAPGEVQQNISVPIVADTVNEADENFTIVLSSPQNARIDSKISTATVTVVNDDAMTVQMEANPTQVKSGETSTLTVRFSEIPQGFDVDDIQVTGGQVDALKADVSGKVWTARFTPAADVNNLTAMLQVLSSGYSDASGQAGANSNVVTLTGDTGLPKLAITSDKTRLKSGESALLTFTLDGPPSGFEFDDIAVTGGSLAALSGTGLTRTTIFTPSANVNDLEATVNVEAGRYTDEHGNLNIASSPVNLVVDTQSPTVFISADKSLLQAGEKAGILFDFSEESVGFTIDDIQVTGGIIKGFKSIGKTYSAQFVPNEDQAVLSATIGIMDNSYTDQAGNTGHVGNVITIGGDTLVPGVTIYSDKTRLKTGEVANITFVFDDIPTGFMDDDIKVSGGSLSPVIGSGLARTAVFTPLNGKNNLNGVISVPAGSYTDATGNLNAASNLLSVSGDTASPQVTITSNRTRFKAGDTAKVTFTFDETPVDFKLDGITVAGGTLSGLTASPDDDKVYTALYTPNPIPPGIPKTTTVLKEKAYGGYGTTSKDYTLVAGGGTFTLKYNMYGVPDKAEIYVGSSLVATTPGFVSNTGSLTVTGNMLNKGAVVTVRMTGKDRGTAWQYDINYSKGVLDPADPANKFTGSIQLGAGTYRDQAGNVGQAATKLPFTGDLLAPGLEIDVSRTNFRAGETANVTFKFEEAPVGFTMDDVKVKGGSLSSFATTDTNQRIYTALLTPEAGVNTVKGMLQIPAGSYTDKQGNPGDAGNPVELSGDTLIPTLTAMIPADDAINVTVNRNLVLTFSEPLKAATGDIIITSDQGDKRTISVSDINQVIFDGNQVILDPKTNLLSGSSYTVQIAGGALRDMAGNPYSGISDSTTWNFSTDNAVFPTISTQNITVIEGHSGASKIQVAVKLSAASTQTVTVRYTTQDGTARTGSDYTATSGALTFKPGETSQTVAIPVLGDTAVEADETLLLQLHTPNNGMLNGTASSALITVNNDDLIPATVMLPVIDLGKNYGKLIHPVQVDGNRVYYYWDRSGDGTRANIQGAGYDNSSDLIDHDSLDKLFQEDISGRVEGRNGTPVIGNQDDTDNTHRYATINGIQLALPTAGDGKVTGFLNGTTIGSSSASGGSLISNPVYDDYLAIWDGYNGTGTGTGGYGVPNGWADSNAYWSATSTRSGHISMSLYDGSTTPSVDFVNNHVAIEVLFPTGNNMKKALPSPLTQLGAASNANLDSAAGSALSTISNDDLIPVSTYTKGQAVIDLGRDYGKLIHPVVVDGDRVYYYWDRSGDGTKADIQGVGYTNRSDRADHDWLDKLFQQDVKGRVEGENGAPVVYQDGDTDNVYRYATVNGVKLALPTLGGGEDFISGNEIGWRNGTVAEGKVINNTYDDYLAIWDAYNGTGTSMNTGGKIPYGWDDNGGYWSATPATSGHAYIGLVHGYVNYGDDNLIPYIAVEVL